MVVIVASRNIIRVIALTVLCARGRVIRSTCVLIDEDKVVDDVLEVDGVPLTLSLVYLLVE